MTCSVGTKRLTTTKGDTFLLALQLVPVSSDTTIDLDTIEDIAFTVREDYTSEDDPLISATLSNGLVTLDDADELIYLIRIPPATMSGISIGEYYYDVQVTLDDDIWTVLKGVFEVTYEVTYD